MEFICHAYKGTSNFGGIEIMFVNDDTIITRYFGKIGRKRKIHYMSSGRPYFLFNNEREYLDTYLRNN